MADGFAQLDAYIARVRALPELARTAAPDVARVVERELRKTISAGTTPDGKPWPLTKDGEKPLTNAAGALNVVAVGTTIYARISGPEARHHLGRARGGIERQILPKDSIPAAMSVAISAELAKHFTEAVSDD